MEQQEKKKRKEHIRRRRQSKPTLSFPIELTSEILLRLPVKSLERFRCVSKLWSSTITDPYFINLFETRSKRPSLLLYIKKDDNLFVYSIPQHQNSNKSYSFSQPTDGFHMKLPSYRYDPCTESVHGLICFLGIDETPIVWNPSKRQFITLPQPMKFSLKDDIRVFLGYDPIKGKHKLVCITQGRDCDVCQVLTLGSAKQSWRMVETKHRSYQFATRGRERCIKGFLYYKAYIYEMRAWVIMSFDVRSEIFDTIQLPSDQIDIGLMMTSDGKLACVKKKPMKGYLHDTITLCILECAEKHEWSTKDFLAPSSYYDQSLETNFNLKGITHAGEFIYVPFKFCKSSYILFYNPVRNNYRRFEFKGIEDDESWLSDKPWLYVFTNHIESQRSL